MSSPNHDETLWPTVLLRDAKEIKFGFITITIHEGHVTQVERVVRTRFAPGLPADRSLHRERKPLNPDRPIDAATQRPAVFNRPGGPPP